MSEDPRETTIKHLEDELATIGPQAASLEDQLTDLRRREQALEVILAHYRGAAGAKRTIIPNNTEVIKPKYANVSTEADYAIKALREAYPDWAATGIPRRHIIDTIKKSFNWSEERTLGLTEELIKTGRILNKDRRWYPAS